MEIAIHRPAQIGGQITKISTQKSSIIIDLGHNLPNNSDDKDPYDNSDAIAEITKACSAILYTHYHGDHIGLFHHVPEDIPQYIGKVAKQVVHYKYKYLSEHTKEETFRHAIDIVSNMHTFQANQKLYLGDIKVTPFFVSHSAYDAHMFLIEAEGKRILHTGDFRRHGFVSKKMTDVVQNYIGQVDVLIIEGTMLEREKAVPTEADLSQEAEKLMNKYKYVFVHCSSTDLERLAGFKNASKKSNPSRPIIADKFQKGLIDIFSKTAGKKTTCFDFGKIYTYSPNNVKLKSWMLEQGFTMFVRANKYFDDCIKDICQMLQPDKEPLFIYSLWNGYIDREDTRNEKYVELQSRFTNVARLHTSGHATIETLRNICELTNPRLAILPIHREKAADFSSIGIPSQLRGKIITANCTLNNILIKYGY